MSAQTLRRYAGFYERVYGPLPREDGQRVFSQEVLERLRAAQAFVAEGRAAGMRGALKTVKDGVPEIKLPPPRVPAAEQLLREVAAAREDVRATLRALGDARDEVAAAGSETSRLVEAVIELADRQARGQEALERRLDGIEAGITQLLGEVRALSAQEPAASARWWPFGRRRGQR